MPADLQLQVGEAADQAQGIGQVIAVDGGQGGAIALAPAIDQQGRIGGDRVAAHQPEAAVHVVQGVERDCETAEQGAAVVVVAPHQVGRAHERSAGDLFAQGQLPDFITIAAHLGQQRPGGDVGVVEHQVELADGLFGGFQAAVHQCSFGLGVEDEGAEPDGKKHGQQCPEGTGRALQWTFGGQGHGSDLSAGEGEDGTGGHGPCGCLDHRRIAGFYRR